MTVVLSRIVKGCQTEHFEPMLQLEGLQTHIDDLYKGAFSQVPSTSANVELKASIEASTGLTEEAFGRLGRTQPQV